MKENINYYGFEWPKKARRQTSVNNYARLSIAFICILALSFLVLFYTANAQTLPAGFSQVQVATGISDPTVMTFAPDGRIFIAQQSGDLRIVKNGALLATPFISLPVNSSGERGLLGIAFDPNFSVNQFIYLYYTVSSAAYNRVSRFTANGDVVVPGSEVIIKNLDPLSSATNHNGGTMQFGPDGKLYIGVGDNANSGNATNLDTYHGKVLRLNSDGTIPTGNPYTTGTDQRKSVWSFGLRNPYTLTFQPGTGRLFINDVGETTWEEINEGTTGGLNFGWPGAEGNSTNPAYTNPIYAYGHGSGNGVGCAITGGTFFNPPATNYPATYTGRYFYIDFCSNWIDMLTLNGTTATRTNFASSIAGFPVSIVTGVDGNLYFLSRSSNALYKIIYSGSSAPLITSQPQSITVSQGNNATFNVTATGTAPLSYQWRKNGSNISGANSSAYTITNVNTSHAGNYSVVVSNGSGTTTSNNATLTVVATNQVPTATISSPTLNFTYAGGDVIAYSGTGTDPEDGNLAAASYQWFVNFHHATHTHPGPTLTSGVTNGSFTVPSTGETAVNVFYRIYLVVTDSQGQKDTAFTDILPRTTQINISTNPQGLQITLDGQPGTSPYIFTSVEGIVRTIAVASPQNFNGQTYNFTGWSNGGSQSQNISTPVNDVVYTANFTSSSSIVLNPVADAFVRSGSFANKNYGNNISLNSKTTAAVNGTYLTYMKFDISSLPATLTSVTLKLYGQINNSNTVSATVQLFDVPNQTWLENTINYSNKPAAGASVLDDILVTGTAFQFYEFDITQHIIALRNAGATTVSLMLKNLNSTSNSRVVFNSSENSSNKPELRITGTGLRLETNISNSFESISGNEAHLSLNLYPNPASDKINLEFSESIADGSISIININGSLIKQFAIYNSNESILDISDLEAGVYMLIYHGDVKSLYRRFIVAR